MTEATKTRRKLRRIEAWILLAPVMIVVLVAAAWGFSQWQLTDTKVTDPGRYAWCLQRVQKRLDQSAWAHMPTTVPQGATEPSLFYYEDHGDRGITLMLRCHLPPAAVTALLDEWGDHRLQIRVAKDVRIGDYRGPMKSYTQPRWIDIEPTADQYTGLPDTFDIVLLHQATVSAGVDSNSGGFVVRGDDGLVIFWVFRHWAPYN